MRKKARAFIQFLTDQISKTARNPVRVLIITRNYGVHGLRQVRNAPPLNFLIVQTTKAIRDPAHLVRIAKVYLQYLWIVRLGGRPLRQPTSDPSSVTYSVPPPLNDDLHANAASGARALNALKIQDAVHFLSHAVLVDSGTSELDHWTKREAAKNLGVALHHGLGRLDEGVFYWREAVRLTRLITQNYAIPALDNADIYDDFWSTHIGHTAILGTVIKRQILAGQADRKRYLVRAPKRSTGNASLVEQMGRFCTLIDDMSQFPIPQQFAAAFGKFFWIDNCLGGPPTYAWQGLAETSLEWEKKGFGPLLAQSPEEIAAAKRDRAELGIPADAWHVCLHVRDSGYKLYHDDLHATLNADIRAYDLAIESVLRRGGWVIRMGDPSMPTLPKTKNVIDYAHSQGRTSERDIGLIATCRFFVGTSSGPVYVPALYGIPSVITNWFPTGTRPLNSYDLFIPMLHWYEREEEFAPFDESMSQPLGHIHALPTLNSMGVALRRNLRDEIRDVVEEMFDRLDGKAEYCDEDHQLQSRYDAVARDARSFGNARIGRDFLRKYQRLLPHIPAGV